LAARAVKRCQRPVPDVGAGRELGQQNPWMKKENPSIPGIAARREIGACGFGIWLLAEVFDCVDAIAQLRAAFDVAVAGGGAIGCDAERYDALTRKRGGAFNCRAERSGVGDDVIGWREQYQRPWVK